ncbi:polymerase [Arsukibacterium ikkense]|uniref:Polymerase n=1 Tax=Arsukibacterium ikkense TaxID=336831 RepID=A0A0M2V405_9GAMM|nr:FapA family protein [Arsukibacterium ikkense]KKO45592.1 polymerase [Arsukibacterium ikkense]
MQFTEHNNTIKITVPVSSTAISAVDIQQQLVAHGFERCLVLQDQLTNLLVEYQQIQQKIKENLVAENAKELSYRIAEKRDAELTFDISEDKMTATAIITAAWGGAPVSANDLVKSAQANGIVFGFSKEQIIKLVSYAAKAEPGSKMKLLIARGRLMKPGVNSRFEPLLAEMESRRNRPVVTTDEKADLRDFGAIPAIKAGEAIMRRHPPTAGVVGMLVNGDMIPATPGLHIEWQLGEGVELAPDNPDLLLAARDGLPRIIEAGATVDEVFTVKNVDLATGHIIFRGSVVVTGNVDEGMKVIAGGNVFVKGMVEGQLIEAGGDITISGSVIGHQLAQADQQSEYSTELKALGDIQCNLAQYSRINCGGNLYVSKQLMHCAVEAAIVYAGPEDNPNGKLVGGFFYLDKGIYCGNLGAPSSSAVLVKLNRQLDPIVEKQEVLRASVAAERAEMEELRQQLEKLKKIEGNAQMEMRRYELVANFDERKELAISLINDIKILEAQRQEKLAELLIVVRQQLFSAVEVHFGKEQVKSRREYGPSKIILVDGKPCIEPL